MPKYESLLYINGEWCSAADGGTRAVINPATEEVVGSVAQATDSDIQRAIDAAQRGFEHWRSVSPQERKSILKRVAARILEQRESLAVSITLEQGKPLEEARLEIDRTVDAFEWCAEEATRTYGRLLPQRKAGSREMVIREPIGPVAGFSPWNFPAAMAARKIAAALGAGCSMVIKPSEEAPAICAGLVQACHDAGVPPGVINLLLGPSDKISTRLIESSVIKKISLTGSVPVGRKVSSLAGQFLKPVTMELGGHAPVIIFDDADVEKAAAMTAAFKFRNAGQVCLGVSRVFVQQNVYEQFLDCFLAHVSRLKLGNGMDPDVTMGPLANQRRLDAMEAMVADAKARGATVRYGGKRWGDQGYFWEPTVITDIGDDALLMREEPFGPVVPVVSFVNFEEVIERANQLPLGLAGYAFTRSLVRSTAIVDALEAGWLGVNNFSPALSEAPFGGMKDSGIGYEGGPEGFASYTQIKFVSQDSL
ncbi:NAD-dependent succinate-semialdehyde dehydrogenase [Marinobacterium aestuariivivens]|uniref:NAD-dependent succinate-semialdehyde dehydrogenase n=1 Tax=Marinobacterium aestuariivivens TaxID=1698799 RepID=A0ABW2A5J1_9GAMM